MTAVSVVEGSCNWGEACCACESNCGAESILAFNEVSDCCKKQKKRSPKIKAMAADENCGGNRSTAVPADEANTAAYVNTLDQLTGMLRETAD